MTYADSNPGNTGSGDAAGVRPGPRLDVLLDRVALGDADAFKQLYDVTSAKLFGLALRILGREGWAEDVVQDAYLRIWRTAYTYRAQLAAPLTWMSAIVRNRAIDFLRHAGGHETDWDDALDHIVPGDSPDPADSSGLSEDARRLAQCMQTLDARTRQAIALAYLRDQSHQEIATTLSTPLGTVKSWVRRGLARLKTCLER